MSHVLKLSLVGYVISLLDVTLQNIFDKIGCVLPAILYNDQFWKSAFLNIFVKCFPLQRDAFSGAKIIIYSSHCAVFGE